MDTRLRYGYGVVLLGLGNVAVGATQLAVGGQTTVVIAMELVIGALLFGFGYGVVSDPDRIDPEQLSPWVITAVGYVGITLGVAMLAWSALVVVNAL
ncbi:hypothetical protein HLRTI_000329 [Halorhabdus tiamatea SARL4B]|uniref:Uncharacterized protein n=1 Tax=Halorhabdus tiamatea SARL4B TaxID=1033806 RepID=F7PK48_9EURY|nr:hypothetical protein [Halorhabdus tiamatea]ERJ07581.1 hypothetical protein HLRTI_000329 [Halorhabdus tiamatea SARL4B]CCQ33469.1 hypothetical protein HTIA_1336 [Halorhabdus tiamatea SARL4B]